MKKVISLSMVCLMALSICAVFSCSNGTYVDLGLPSGTKWKISNEANDADAGGYFFTYEEAVSRFDNSLPTIEQWEELKVNCMWTWYGSGYKVTGPNGNYIVLPAAGHRGCSGSVYDVGSYGRYWSSLPAGSDYAWYLNFDSCSVGMNYNFRCYGISVRLVQD